VVAGHHEKWDGKGYPRALSGENIPLAARIFAIADVFDALVSRRPYKEAMPFAAAIEIIRQDSGSHFDPALAAIFLNIAETLHTRLQCCDEADCRRLLDDKVRHHFFAQA
jgi:HD-GYP domain-containing protein (c-di-GMP phosphodiesterase class II)